ncbi:hypothetical protein RJT34_19931 [Clitoria ternatea]|uniref:Uncharacterized protein n=1 Tax=Clitoria ternatea TaxID=43366 RepID=A0AAN9P4D1_CLITE
MASRSNMASQSSKAFITLIEVVIVEMNTVVEKQICSEEHYLHLRCLLRFSLFLGKLLSIITLKSDLPLGHKGLDNNMFYANPLNRNHRFFKSRR